MDPKQLMERMIAVEQLLKKIYTRVKKAEKSGLERRMSLLVHHFAIMLSQLRVDQVKGSLNIGNNFSRFPLDPVPHVTEGLNEPLIPFMPKEMPGSASAFSPNFHIGSIRINSIERASCLNMGNNLPLDFTSHNKVNQGFGSISGDQNSLFRNRGTVEDPDLIDMLNMENEGDGIPEWIKETITNRMKEMED